MSQWLAASGDGDGRMKIRVSPKLFLLLSGHRAAAHHLAAGMESW